MKVGRPFRLKGIYNNGDRFIPVTFKCRTCKQATRAVYAENIFMEICGARLDCLDCAKPYIQTYLEAASMDFRDRRRKIQYLHFK